MKITSVTVHKITGENSRMRGIATVVLDDCFKIKGIRIIEKDDKLMLAMPSRKNRNGENEDVAHPLKYHFPYLRPPIGTFTFGARSSSSQVAA